MKKLFLSTLFILFTSCLFSQQKIGHVNSQEIFAAMPDIKLVDSKLQKESKKMDEMLIEMQQKTQEAAQGFQAAQQNGESKSVIEAKYKEAVDLENRMNGFLQDAQKELESLRNELVAPIMEKVQNAINEVAKDGKFSYILDIGSGFPVILYNQGSDAHDITTLVKKELKL